ncbi:MAG: FtsQ-type POTRA domain-containing protein [Nitrospira sp.]|nr:FtsQ-type POTRA domain-containing protein [Nitrospira sp.]MCP9441294.1 FtsQ-type POTRA domain-containing protein [Nitrospira sp.]
MRLFRKRWRSSQQRPRKNQWKCPRAADLAHRNVETKRSRIVAKLAVVTRWAGAVVGVALIGWAIAMSAQYAGPFLDRLLEIKKVTVEGLRRIDRGEIIDLVKLEPRTALHHVSTADIKDRVESHPWIKHATVDRVPPNELRITVVERVPGAVVSTGKEIVLVDEEGHVLAPLSEKNDDGALPFLSGVDRKGLLRGDKDVRRAILSGIELAKIVGQTYEGPVRVNVADPANLIVSVGSTQFHFDEEGVEDQWDRFRQVKQAVQGLDVVDGYGDGVNDVDLRYENRVIVRERG